MPTDDVGNLDFHFVSDSGGDAKARNSSRLANDDALVGAEVAEEHLRNLGGFSAAGIA